MRMGGPPNPLSKDPTPTKALAHQPQCADLGGDGPGDAQRGVRRCAPSGTFLRRKHAGCHGEKANRQQHYLLSQGKIGFECSDENRNRRIRSVRIDEGRDKRPPGKLPLARDTQMNIDNAGGQLEHFIIILIRGPYDVDQGHGR